MLDYPQRIRPIWSPFPQLAMPEQGVVVLRIFPNNRQIRFVVCQLFIEFIGIECAYIGDQECLHY